MSQSILTGWSRISGLERAVPFGHLNKNAKTWRQREKACSRPTRSLGSDLTPFSQRQSGHTAAECTEPHSAEDVEYRKYNEGTLPLFWSLTTQISVKIENVIRIREIQTWSYRYWGGKHTHSNKLLRCHLSCGQWACKRCSTTSCSLISNMMYRSS